MAQEFSLECFTMSKIVRLIYAKPLQHQEIDWAFFYLVGLRLARVVFGWLIPLSAHIALTIIPIEQLEFLASPVCVPILVLIADIMSMSHDYIDELPGLMSTRACC
jgi:hypothetical protein